MKSKNRSHLRHRLASAAAVMVVLFCCMGPAAASAAADWANDAMTVRELMQLDAAHALDAARNRQRAPGPHQGAAADPANSGPLTLHAIYGVGKRLMAEVRVGGRPHLYMKGRAHPVGQGAHSGTWRLRALSATCAHLELDTESRTLCLAPSSWTAR